MKLRIKGNSIRFRLSQTEVDKFGKDGLCADSTCFVGGTLSYQLVKAPVEHVQATLHLQQVLVEVPEAIAFHWTNDATQVGFDHVQNVGGGQELRILVEKDFACLTERPHEDESDNFPNPMTKC